MSFDICASSFAAFGTFAFLAPFGCFSSYSGAIVYSRIQRFSH